MAPLKLIAPFGKNGPPLPRIAYGAMGLSQAYGPPPSESSSFAALSAAYACGARLFDTANIYGNGHNEELLRKWLALPSTPSRADIFLATKFGITLEPSTENAMGFKMQANGSRAYARKCLDESLARLGTGWVDLYYIHRIDPKVPIEETMLELKQMVAEGKIRRIGISEPSPSTVRRAHAIHPIAAVQQEFSLFSLNIEEKDENGESLMDVCLELGIAVVAYSPLGRGLLSGTVKSPADFEAGDFRKILPRFQAEVFHFNLELVEAIKKVADKKGVPAGNVALAWLLSQGEHVFVIPGSRQVKYIEENARAGEVELSKEELKELREDSERAEKGLAHLGRSGSIGDHQLGASTVGWEEWKKEQGE